MSTEKKRRRIKKEKNRRKIQNNQSHLKIWKVFDIIKPNEVYEKVFLMIIKILDKSTIGSDISADPLRRFGEVYEFDSTSASELLERVSDADVIIVNKVKMTREVMKAAKRLRLICVYATGYDNIDLAAARELGIGVCNVPAYSTDSVLLFTISKVLSLVSHLSDFSEFVRSGEYSASGAANRLTPVYHELRGMTWGIVGYGNIGRAVGDVARAFGASVIVNKREPALGVRCVDIDTLCRESDIITLHCPLNEETRGLIGSQQISLMKKGVVLVNESRGAVTDESAIAEAVLDGRIGGFGSDVYSVEPFGEEHPFFSIKELSNVILTPHSAWAAYEARERCMSVIAENINSFICEKTLNRVDI